jgi:hypothetical protein
MLNQAGQCDHRSVHDPREERRGGVAHQDRHPDAVEQRVERESEGNADGPAEHHAREGDGREHRDREDHEVVQGEERRQAEGEADRHAHTHLPRRPVGVQGAEHLLQELEDQHI